MTNYECMYVTAALSAIERESIKMCLFVNENKMKYMLSAYIDIWRIGILNTYISEISNESF